MWQDAEEDLTLAFPKLSTHALSPWLCQGGILCSRRGYHIIQQGKKTPNLVSSQIYHWPHTCEGKVWKISNTLVDKRWVQKNSRGKQEYNQKGQASNKFVSSRIIKGNKKSSCKFISSKRKTKQNIGSLLNREWKLLTEDNIRETNNSDKEVKSWHRIRQVYGRGNVIELDAFRFIWHNELHWRCLEIWLQQSQS